MKLPRLFLKDKNLEGRVESFLNRTEKDLPANFSKGELVDKICKYLDLRPYNLFYESSKTKVVEYVDSTEHKGSRDLGSRIRDFEKDMGKQNIKWEWLSHKYTENYYKETKKEIRSFIKRSFVVGYSKLVNYLPVKSANFFFKISDRYDSSRWDILGIVSYLAILAGEIAAVSLLTSYGLAFGVSVAVAGAYQLMQFDYDVNMDTVKEYINYLKEYKQVNKNRLSIDVLRSEKQQISEILRDEIKPR